MLRNFRSFKIRHIWLRCSWPPHEALPTHPDLGPALLVYADLVATGDERNLETAQLLYDHHIV
ncbi:MAG: hypothetical protein JST84_05630 [Acidobacteria bacterium]|nr:hypothetical protein [Acidobacteriota bacterium]